MTAKRSSSCRRRAILARLSAALISILLPDLSLAQPSPPEFVKPELVLQAGHGDQVDAIAFSPGG